MLMRRRAIGVRLPFVARAGVVTDVGRALDAARRSRGVLLLIFAGTQLIEFSPTEALNSTMAVVGNNLQAKATDVTSRV